MNVFGFLLLMFSTVVVGVVLFWGEDHWNRLPDVKCHRCGHWGRQQAKVCKNCDMTLTKEEKQP